MNRFAALLDRLAYEPRRNAKLRLLVDYFRHTPDPDRGYALAALTGSLMFKEAKAGLDPRPRRGADRPGAVPHVVQLCGRSRRDVGADLAGTRRWGTAPRRAPRASATTTSAACSDLTEVVETLATASKSDLPARIAGWLDALDETGRWALLKLITRELRVGVSARLAKTAVAQLGGVRAGRGGADLARARAALRGVVRLGRGARAEARIRQPRAVSPADAVASARGRGFREARRRRFYRRMEMGRHPPPGRRGPRRATGDPCGASIRGPARTCRALSRTSSRR